jgi:uncharacterized protein (TIGR02145 family)
MSANINGLIYYKLDANLHGYPGDITKNCGLRGEEIDGNFNFLRSQDIKSISFDENGTLYLTRYNGEVITAKQTEKPEYDFSYNPEDGILTIVTPNGKEIVLSGFKVTRSVYHDFTLAGAGLQETPLEVSNLAKTGRYRPAIKLLDTTQSEMLPTVNVAAHDRYVTKEKVSRFGRLFSWSGVEKIAERLQRINSEWHVPTKAEWDEILNVIDCAMPNHSKVESNVELGETAGSELKATKYWKLKDNSLLSDDSYGFSIYPVGYCGNRGKNYYGSFGESAAFWTATVEDNHKDMYVKSFNYDTTTVAQNTWGDNYYLSLRLVKKFTGNNFNDAEDIDGFTSNCVHIPGTSLIWTRDNIAFSQEQYDGFYPEEWTKYENDEIVDGGDEIRYFINDWNGNGWDKHELKEGEGIVLYEGDNGNMHEWLLINGELIDSVLHVKQEFEKTFEEINNRISEETLARQEADEQLQANIDAETTARKEADELEAKTRQDADDNIKYNLELESDARKEADEQLQVNIDGEANARQDADLKLADTINAETIAREDADKMLQEAINDEANNRNESDNILQRHIDENKVTPEDTSVIVVPGTTNEEGLTTPTTIKVNLPENGMIKVDEFGLYFDGNFGTF